MTSKFIKSIALLWVFLCLLEGMSTVGYGHPISISDVYVEVQSDRLHVRLEVFVEDLYLFHQLELDDDNRLPMTEIRKGVKQHQAFLKEKFYILDADGDRLPAQFLNVDDQDLPDSENIPFEHLMFHKLYYEFAYEVASPPEFLTFVHQFVSERSAFPAEVNVKVKPISGRRKQQLLLPNQPWTISLTSDNGQEQGTEGMSAESSSLGLSTYGETYAFWYVEPEEMRLEVLIPLATLAGSLDLELDPDGKLDVSEQQRLKPEVQDLFQEQIQWLGDGTPLNVAVDRIEFFGVAIRDLSRTRDAQTVGMANARVGIILSTPVTDPIQQSQLTWQLFNESLYQVRLTMIHDLDTKQQTLRDVEDQNVMTLDVNLRGSLTDQASQKLMIDPKLQRQIESATSWRNHWMTAVVICYLPAFALFFIVLRRSPAETRVHKAGLYSGSYLGVTTVLLISFFALQYVGGNRQIETLGHSQEIPEKLEQLLSQVYAAVNLRNEEDVYDQLAQVVEGDLLRELYLDLRKSMTLESQGGAVGRASGLTLEESQFVGGEWTDLPMGNDLQRWRPQLEYQCQWSVEGRVEHWGHIHERTSTYQAMIELTPVPAGQERAVWKLTRIELQNISPAAIETSVRTF